ncbi:MAG: hypothetical protein WC729_12765 [Sphingomonas sp.]|uniref:hypothetical protein n=1 Tax=Sphingomonas sp. TaxID=28214 RepID=UPI003563D632
MSTPTFLAIAVACGGGVFALMMIIGKLAEPLGALHRHWLERRHHRRLARGNDSYFEELRSIESALARENPTRGKIGTLDYALGLLFAVVVGTQVLTWFVPETERPGWTEHVGTSIFILLGIQMTTGNAGLTGAPTRATRLIGLAWIAFFSFFLILDLSKMGGAS